MRTILKVFSIIIFILTTVILMFLFSFFVVKKDYVNFTLKVKKGETIISVYNELKLNYSFMDKIYFKLDPKSARLSVGTYKFNGEMSKYEVLEKLKNPDITEIKLTIPEGFTQRQVFDRIIALGLGTEEEIKEVLSKVDFPYPHDNNNFEGYFYPETYIFNENMSVKEVIETILNEFLKKFPVEKNKDKKEFYDQLKMASLVEAEVHKLEDKPRVAGIFLKRLLIGMRLESDATLKYELGRQAKRGELKNIESPYNSYKVYGLPPTPIGNPPIETMEAVKNAIITDDLFFFTHKGKTYYSKTHKEHLRKRRESGQLK